MRDEECVQFLQWALPQLHMRWPGFRKVRDQVCKRIQRRINKLAIKELADYRRYLELHDNEWTILNDLCRVTISRFYRDKQMFAFLEREVLPTLAQQNISRDDDCLKVWSIGAGSGEEPYTLSIIWKLLFQNQFADMHFQILATDADPSLLMRARTACYEFGSVKNLPEPWRNKVFNKQDAQFCLKLKYKDNVKLMEHDVRDEFTGNLIEEGFDLILCRNLVFTYFDEPLQYQTFARIMSVLRMGGALVLGIHENLPDNASGVESWSERLRVFEKK